MEDDVTFPDEMTYPDADDSIIEEGVEEEDVIEEDYSEDTDTDTDDVDTPIEGDDGEEHMSYGDIEEVEDGEDGVPTVAGDEEDIIEEEE